MSQNHRRFAVLKELQKQLAVDGIYFEDYQFQHSHIVGNCSGIYRLKYTYSKNHQRYEKSVIMKIPSDGVFYDHLRFNHLYHNEALMYNEILPEMYKFWNDAKFTPENYLLSPNLEDLVIEDLVSSGYCTLDKMSQFDFDHSEKVLTTLAKFHALSVKLYETNPQILEKLNCSYDISPGTPLHTYTDTLYNRFLKTIEQFSLPENVTKKLIRFKEEQLWNEINRTISVSDGFNVLNHSDTWSSNIMFNYNEDGTVREAKLIDFQIVHRSSPVIDLISFFVSSVKFEVFEQYGELLLKIYLDKLNETMKSLQCSSIYDEKDLRQDLYEFRFMYLTTISTQVAVILREEKNSANDNGKEMLPFSSPVYKDVALKWIKYLILQGVL